MGDNSRIASLPPGRITRIISDNAFSMSGIFLRLNPAVAQAKLSSENGRERESPDIIVMTLDIPREEIFWLALLVISRSLSLIHI